MWSRGACLLLALTLLASCGDAGERPDVSATGPPVPDLALIERHAEQFDSDIPDRAAGSQEEQAASVYITGHLQLAGYVVFLDGVPVADLVRSTNVVGRPPSGEAPEVVVATPYDTGENHDRGGLALGVFLETARALNVAAPGHDVSFVALGAEHSDESGGRLGSRREARLLLDDSSDPLVVTLGDVVAGGDLVIQGVAPQGLVESLSSEAGCTDGACIREEDLPEDDVFSAAGLGHVRLSGDPGDVALGLLAFLASAAR